MSVVFDLKTLDKEQSEKICKHLTFIPEENKFVRPNKFNIDGGEPVRMYYTKDGKTRLPYRFSCAFFKKIFNIDKDFPKIYTDKKDKFSGRLLDRQKEPFKEAVKYLKKYNTVTIALYPGFGKTFMGTMLSWYLNLYTCVLVHRENVGKQWVKTFEKYFDLKEQDIWYVGEKFTLDGKKYGPDKIKSEAKIIICMDGRTDKIPQSMKDSIGCLLIDEAHCFCSPSKVKPLLSFSPKYTIAETATPKKDNGMHKVIQSICGTHYIQKVSTKPYNFFIIQTNLEYELEGSKNIFGDLVNQQCKSERRNEIILKLLECNKDYKTIIAGNRKEHCKFLNESLTKMGLESSELYGTIKNYKTKNILIGTGSKMGVGFDEENFCDDFDGRPSDLLLMLTTYASWAPFEQVRGRGMRTETPNVVVFNDKHPITKKHMTQIRKWVRETNGKIIELNVDKMESFDINTYK